MRQCGFYHTDFNCSIIGGAAFMGNFQSAEPLSAEVLAHTPTIQRYASEYGNPRVCCGDTGNHDAGKRRKGNRSHAVQ